MKYLERQKKIENKVFEAIEEIAEAFEADVPFYPEVYWIGRGVEFEYLGLPEKYRIDFNDRKFEKSSTYLRIPKVILITKDYDSHLGEEAAHFVHLVNSRIDLCKQKTTADWTAVNILIEMFGFLGSKIICPEREDPYASFRDFIDAPLEEAEKFRKILNRIYGKEEGSFAEFFIHQQGYGLAERIFATSKNEDFVDKRIKQLFFEDFNKKHSATKQFLRLRQEFWPMASG